jgi:hypothetical protein
MRKIQIAIMAAALCLAIQAQAAMYNIAFDIQGNQGSGTLTATDIGGGSFLVTAASVLVTAGSWASPTPYILAPPPSEGHFAGGADMIFDNIIRPAHTPSLDGDGLGLWTASGLTGLGINIWGNSGATDYTFFGLGQLGSPNVTGGTVTLTAVPEPTTMVAGAGALGLALLGIGRARRSSVVRIGK